MAIGKHKKCGEYQTSNGAAIKNEIQNIPIGSHLELLLYDGVVCDFMRGCATTPVVNWPLEDKDIKEDPGVKVTGYLMGWDNYQNYFTLVPSEIVERPSHGAAQPVFKAGVPGIGRFNLYYDTVDSIASVRKPEVRR